MSAMMFKIGDQVVHPQHGVGQIVKLEDREFGSGVIRQYYEVSLSGSSTMWVPVDLVAMGLRRPAERTEISRCRKILSARATPLTEEGRTRQASLAARLKQGTISTFCEVVRDLFAFGEHKSLYGTIAGFYKVTKDVLCQEWAMVEGITHLQAAQEIDDLLTRGRETMKAARA